MPRPNFVDAILVVALFALVGGGFALFGSCGGGVTLALFGGAFALLGVELARSGAWATLIPTGIVVLILAIVAAYTASGAGCY